jgi:hypothetical protein
MRELEVAALAADLGGEEQLRSVGVAEARHLAVPLHEREVAVVPQRLDPICGEQSPEAVQRGQGLGEEEDLRVGLVLPDSREERAKRLVLRVTGRE